MGERVRAPVHRDERVVILGAGPCGLACARELERLGHYNWVVLERTDHPGGLASSVVDPAGFTWDHGGHVVFSHFGEFDRLLREMLGEEVLHHERSSFVRFRDRWVPYPFQSNLRHLPPDVAYECIVGLVGADGAGGGLDFATWMTAVFGEGVTRHFMAPYNWKVWATPLDRMSSTWLSERVAVPDYRRALRNILYGTDDLGWGPNNRFAFPARGGTGEIYRRLAASLGSRVRYRADVCSIDATQRIVRTADGGVERYDVLVSTAPLDRLVEAMAACPKEVRHAARELEHNEVYVVGVGYQAPLRDDRSWLYFPGTDVPFYRATNFAKYAPSNVPDGDTTRFSSYMTEVSHSRWRPRSPVGIEDEVDGALRAQGVVAPDATTVSTHVIPINRAYPVPTLGRDGALAVIHEWLMANSIYSRGRMGSWRYEIGNMDHAVKMGIDVARHVTTGQREELWA